MGDFFPHNQSEFLTRSRDKKKRGFTSARCVSYPSFLQRGRQTWKYGENQQNFQINHERFSASLFK